MVLIMRKQKKRRPISKPSSVSDLIKVAGSALGAIGSLLKIVDWAVSHWPPHWPF